MDVGVGEGREFNRGSIGCIRSIYTSDGVRGLYRGIGASMIGVVLYRGIYFGAFDTGKFLMRKDNENPSLMNMWLLAQSITLLAGTLTYPLDTVRGRLMMQSA
jgi:solute carrier family 25 (adenine nucleotide translocator) protein 4/5/6/31